MSSILPVYYQIKQSIKSWILNREFNPGEKIPSENELASKFSVSRLTVRQAISQLVQEGFLNSKRGEGTFVTNNENLINSFGLEFSGYMDDLFYQVSKVKAKSVEMEKIKASRLVREKLELDDEIEEVVQIRRVRLLRDKPFAYTINYLPMEIG
jgi:GntR family transcriptional regulator